MPLLSNIADLPVPEGECQATTDDSSTCGSVAEYAIILVLNDDGIGHRYGMCRGHIHMLRLTSNQIAQINSLRVPTLMSRRP